MELKDFNEIENKKELLMHWWHYYGKMIYTFEEMEQFHQLLEQDCEKVFDVAIASYISGMSSQVLLQSMRDNRVDELFNSLPDISQMPEDTKKAYDVIKKDFLTEISSTYGVGHDDSTPKTKQLQ